MASSTVLPPPETARSTALISGLRLSAVGWRAYGLLLEALEGRHLRITYDRGEVEMMTVSAEHESFKKLLARLLEALTEELDIPVRSLGNTTFRLEDAERGLEPDECWYVQHEAEMRDRLEVDLSSDPPPDLALEVEITRSALRRMSIYAELGVPEVWRFDGERLTIHLLDQGAYIIGETSPAIGSFPLALITDALLRRGKVGETQLVKEFREAVRRQR